MKLSNWIKCLDGDHRYAREKVEKNSEETEQDLIEWLRIYDTYLIKYGFNKKYLKILKVLKKIALLELKWVRTRDPFLETRIEMEREKLKALRKEHGPGVSVERALIYIGKWYGSHLQPDKITVSEYEELSQAYRDEVGSSKADKIKQRKNKR